jgi:hypothetical protein
MLISRPPISRRLLSRPTRGIISAASGGMPPLAWVNDWILATAQKPSATLDFVNGKYYDGVGNTTLAALAQNATVDANGLICNAGNINVLGAFLTAMKNAGGATVVAEISGGNNSGSYGILSMSSGGPDSAMIVNGSNTSMDAFPNSSSPGPTGVDFTKLGSFATAWNNAGSLAVAGIGKVVSYAKNFSAVTTAQFGSYNGGSLWPGRIRSIAIYTGKLSDQYLKNMAWPGRWNKPFNGSTGVGSFNSTSSYINAGNTLASYFKSATPWSCVVGHIGGASGAIKVLFTNVQASGPPWYGHEFYINAGTGKLRTSIFSNWAGGAASTNLIQVEGTTNVNDNNWHVLGTTYDGSGLAAGVKMYVDGVPETTVTTFDNLTGASDTIIGPLEVGGQFGGFCADYIWFFALSNIARSAAYFANINATRVRPSPDANTLVQYDFREGSGSSTADRSANGYNGTFVGALPWL